MPSFQGRRDFVGFGPVPAATCDPERVADGSVDPSDMQAPAPEGPRYSGKARARTPRAPQLGAARPGSSMFTLKPTAAELGCCLFNLFIYYVFSSHFRNIFILFEKTI